METDVLLQSLEGKGDTLLKADQLKMVINRIKALETALADVLRFTQSLENIFQNRQADQDYDFCPSPGTYVLHPPKG